MDSAPLHLDPLQPSARSARALRRAARILVLCLIALLAGCAAPTPMPPEPAAATATPASTWTALPPTATVTAPALSTSPSTAPAETLPPAATATPAPTAAPTATATIALPVGTGQDLPALALAPVSAANAASLAEIARYGSAKYLGSVLNDSGSAFLEVFADGLTIMDTTSKQQVGQIRVDVPTRSATWLNGRKNSVAGISGDGKYVLVLSLGSGADSGGAAGVTAGEGGGATVDLWQVDGKKAASFTLDKSSESVDSAAAVSAEGSLVALSTCPGRGENDCTFSVVDWRAGTEVFKGRGAIPVFSPNGKYLAINFDRNITVYSIQDWTRVVDLPEPRTDTQSQWQKQFTPDGEKVAIIQGKEINVWAVAGRVLVRMVNTFEPGSYLDDLPGIVFTPDSRMAAVLPFYSGRKIILVELASGKQTSPDAMYDRAQAYWFSADGSLERFSAEAVESYPGVTSYGAPYFVFGNPMTLYYGRYEFVQAAGLNRVGDTACQAGRCVNDTYDAGTAGVIHDAGGNAYTLKAAETKNQFQLLKNGQPAGLITGRANNTLMAVNGDMLLVASSNQDGGSPLAQLVDLKDGKALANWPAEIEMGHAMLTRNWAVFLKSPGGMRRSINDYHLVVFDRASGKTIYDKQGYGAIAAVEQQQKVLLVDAGCVTVVDIAANKAAEPACESISMADHAASGFVETVSTVSPDGALAAVGMGGGRVRIIDTATGKQLASWQAHMGEVFALAFDPAGTRLASFGDDGFVKVWAVQK